MDPMDKKAKLEARTLSRAGRAESGGQAGFTLLEVVCVLAIITLLAAIALPAMPSATSLPRIEGYALETAALLDADQAAAQEQQRQVATIVDAAERAIQSGASGRILRFPSDVTVQAVVASRCNGSPAEGTIRFLQSGMSCGGVIALMRGGVGYQIRVNWLTGGAEVVPVH